jgi:hypothetical protein
MNDAMLLPQDLTKLTKAQIKAIIAYHNTLTLAQLRQRQAIVKEQKIVAFKEQNEHAMNNLEVKDQILIQVIFAGKYKR